MPSISGVIAYDSANTYTFPNAAPAGRITGVPIVLQDTNTGVGLTILTDSLGAFTFNSVPAGNYILIEAWGATGAIASPGDFSTATVISSPTPQDPPINKAPSPPATATRLQSLTRNTIPLTVTIPNLTNQNFVDGPIIETPIALRESSIVGNNLIIDAENGRWGTLPNGAQNQLIPATAPYLGIVPSETYFASPSTIATSSAVYNVTNIAYSGSYTNLWYSFSNHTTFDETSRMMVINAAGLGPASNERFFQVTIPNLTPNSYYIAFAWVAYLQNLVIGTPPQVGVKVSNTSGSVIFNSPTPQLTFSNPPNWVQIGGVFNVGNNNTAIVAYQSIATGTLSNDFVADDFSIFQLNVNNFVSSTKTVDKTIAKIGDTLNYTIVLNNTGSITAENVQFQDTIPSGTIFQTGSTFVNSINQPTFNPNTGFNIGGIQAGKVSTITFKVTVVSVPASKKAINNSTAIYSFSPVIGGITIPQSVFSNEVQTDIVNTVITKTASNNFIDINDSLKYTLIYTNQSSFTATNAVLIDTIPSGTTFVTNSVTLNGVAIAGNPNPPGIVLPDVSPNSTVTLTFDVLSNNSLNQNPIINSGTLKNTFTNTVGDSVVLTVNSNITTTTIVSSILNLNKQVNKSFANIGDILTYTIPVSNVGNTTAINILFIDTIPNGTSFISGSLKQDGVLIAGTPNPPGVLLPTNLRANGITTINFQVLINTIPSPNPIPNIATTIFSYTIDNGTLPIKTGTNSSASNLVNTQINNANLSNIKKFSDKSFANCGDIITYTIVIFNSGNVTAQNVVFKDTIPNGTSFVTNSVTINGITQTNANPNSGMSIPVIAPNGVTTITFKVQVTC